MELNSDFTARVVIYPADYRWVDSPMPGVERMMLDRIGDEVARATSLVRYAPNSHFSPHIHHGGEEFLVLEGEFADEHRVYPAGSYVRNPIGTGHTPRIGEQGCIIFVKLYQFDPEDRTPVIVDTRAVDWLMGDSPGAEDLHLHEFQNERVCLLRRAPNAPFGTQPNPDGDELLILSGSLHDATNTYPAGTWIRSPDQAVAQATAGDKGALVFRKTGHLPAAA